MAMNLIQVNEAMATLALLARDTARAWSTEARRAETASIQAQASSPVAQCMSAFVVSSSAQSTAAAFNTAAQMTRDNDRNFTEFLRHYADSTAVLGGDHGLRVSEADYSIKA